MYLMAGLGNPDKKYEKTRHNMGFDCIDILAEKLGIKVNKRGFRSRFGKGRIAGQDVILLKPQTYMNLSGNAVAAALKYYKLDPKTDLIVIYDDCDLGIGHLRVRKQGSAGGHNGMKNIITCLSGNEEFVRIRVGIGQRPPQMDMIDFVLGRFPAEERKVIDATLERAADCAEAIVTSGIDKAMNLYNG